MISSMILHRLRRPWILIVIGAVLGIASFELIFPAQHAECHNRGEKEAGILITELVPQPTQRYFQPKQLELKASRQLFSEMKQEDSNTYYMPCGKNCHAPQRALRQLGMQKVNVAGAGRIQHLDWAGQPGYVDTMESWQRFNHIPNAKAFTKKDSFLTGMAAYKDQHGAQQVYFMPDNYRLHNAKERASLERTVKSDNRPWILRQGLGQAGVTKVLTPNGKSKATMLQAISTTGDAASGQQGSPLLMEQSIATQYVCNQLTWEGNLFSVRIFWFVASLDPLLVFYQDGFARIGYNQTDPLNLKVSEQVADFDSFQDFLHDYHALNRRKLSKIIGLDMDPVVHVRNQFKQTLATVVDAFRDESFSMQKDATTEDGYQVFSADFVLDKDLDVYLMEVNSDSTPHAGEHNAFMLEDNYFLLQKQHELWYGMGLTLKEVWNKQARGNQNILPLQTTGKWDLIAASNKKTNSKELDWKFDYKGYKRDTKKKDKKCNLWKNKQMRQRMPRMAGDEEPSSEDSSETNPMSEEEEDEEMQ